MVPSFKNTASIFPEIYFQISTNHFSLHRHFKVVEMQIISASSEFVVVLKVVTVHLNLLRKLTMRKQLMSKRHKNRLSPGRMSLSF